MDILNLLSDELLRFLGIGGLWRILQTGDYAAFATFDGLKALLGPLLPFILLIEIGRSAIYQKWSLTEFRIPLLIYVFNRVVSRFISIAAVGFCIGVLEKYMPFRVEISWLGMLYGYVAWELGHFIYHWLGHKVRLFWCLHSTHHAPEHMNLSVSYAHFFLEAPYADVIRTTVCLMLGVAPPLLFVIMFVDGFWGTFIHVGEGVLRDGRLGFLEKYILTPSHHRVHHARNPLYMDTNFCNLLNIWDRLFRTYQPEDESVAVEYGITRPLDAQNFADVYFGEFAHLWRDVRRAPGLLNKLRYLVMPPGWNHAGEHKTAAAMRAAYLRERGQAAG